MRLICSCQRRTGPPGWAWFPPRFILHFFIFWSFGSSHPWLAHWGTIGWVFFNGKQCLYMKVAICEMLVGSYSTQFYIFKGWSSDFDVCQVIGNNKHLHSIAQTAEQASFSRSCQISSLQAERKLDLSNQIVKQSG